MIFVPHPEPFRAIIAPASQRLGELDMPRGGFRPGAGRPPRYSDELAREVCRLLGEGQTLREICRREEMPSASTVREWVVDDRDGFAERYARARRLQAEYWADEIVEVAEDGRNDWTLRQRKDGDPEPVLDREHVQRSALRVDTKKWLLAKLHPESWGERVHQVLTGENGGPIATTSRIEDNRPPLATFLQEWSGPQIEPVPAVEPPPHANGHDPDT